jgi:hypothetical protein
MQDDLTPEQADKRLDDVLRKALKTPPISNEDILKRSKEARFK